MNRALGILGVLVLALVLWERVLVQAAVEERLARGRVGRLIPEEERAGMPIAAVRVELGSGGRFLYGRLSGQWRCLDFHRALVNEEALSSLVEKLTRAQGFVVSEEPGEAGTYGIGTRETVRVSLCGPQVLEDPGGDVLVTFDVGRSVAGREGAFVRLRGSKEVWGIDADPHVELAPRAPGLPPLVDGAVVPQAWPGHARGVGRVFVDFPDGTGYELRKVALELAPEELQRGRLPWAWVIDPGVKDWPTSVIGMQAYTLFFQRAPVSGIVGEEEREARVGGVKTVVTVVAAGVEPLVLEIGQPDAEGRVGVWNGWSGSVLVVEEEVARLLAPRIELLREGSEENPWDPWLRR